MGRLGVPLTDAPALVSALKASPHFDLEGIMTHYSRADDDAEFTGKQVWQVEALEASGTSFRYRHAVNSAGTLLPAGLGPVYKGNLARTGRKGSLFSRCARHRVRCSGRSLPAQHVLCRLVCSGIALYGCVPGPLSVMPPGLKPAMTWVSEVAQVSVAWRGGTAWLGQHT